MKKNAVLVEGVILNGPIIDSGSGEKFVEEVFRILMNEIVYKATDVTEKVKLWLQCSLESHVRLTFNKCVKYIKFTKLS